MVELVRAVADDGVALHGAWMPPAGDAGDASHTGDASHAGSPELGDAVLLLPGVGGSFYTSQLLGRTAELFADRGLATLRVNTRGHDTLYSASTQRGGRMLGAAAEIVDECRLDIASWLKWLADRGLRRIILWGHSLGAIKAVYWQALAPQAAVTRVVAMSPPRLSGRAFRHGEGSAAYLQSLAEARRHVAEGRGATLIESRFPFPMLMAAETFLDKYGGERYSIEELVDQLTCPTLFLYGERELASGQVAFAGLDESLAARGAAASPPREIAVEIVPGADHSYSDCIEAAFSTVNSWLAE